MKVSIVGASGYGGGELLRLLLQHPQIEIHQCTSERFAGKPITRLHPNLRKQTTLKFCSLQDLDKVDLLFTALPHSHCMQKFEEFSRLADRMIDLSADFRLKDLAAYSKWYGLDHAQPKRLAEFVYGNVELHREEMKQARYISGAGCNATATILPLWPLFKQEIVDTIQVIRDAGLPAGVAGHAPYIFDWAEHHLDLDFYMCCYYNPSPRDKQPWHDPTVKEQYLEQDRQLMIERIKTLSKPVIHDKVLAAGRNDPRAGLFFAAQNMRPGDAVCVGFYTKDDPAMIAQDIAWFQKGLEAAAER